MWASALALLIVCHQGVSLGADISWLTRPDRSALQEVDSADRSSPPFLLRIRDYRYDSTSVHLYVSVVDSSGRSHTGLTRDHFHVTAGDSGVVVQRFGTFASLPDQYHTWVLGLGLARPNRKTVSAVRQSAVLSVFAELREEKPDYCALMTFSGAIAVPQLFTSDPLLLQRELSRIHFPGEGLRLISALESGRDLIRQTDTSGFAALIMVCDAADSGSAADPVVELEAAGSGDYPPIFFITLAAEPAPWQGHLARWSHATGGEAYRIAPGRDALQSVFAVTVDILQSQYVVTIPAGTPHPWQVTCLTEAGPVSATVSIPERAQTGIGQHTALPATSDQQLIRYLLLGTALLAVLVLGVFIRNRRA